MHGKANSIAVDIPPMSVMYLKPSSIQPEDEQEKIIDLEALTEQPNAEPVVEAKPKRTRKKAAPKAEEESVEAPVEAKPKRTRKATQSGTTSAKKTTTKNPPIRRRNNHPKIEVRI